MISYNSQPFLRAFLNSLKSCTTIPFRLIIIDNRSTDNSCTFLSHFKKTDPLGSRIKIVYQPTNIGVAKAWNKGIDLGDGKYIGFLNPDILFSKGWLNQMVDSAERHPNSGVIGAKILDYSGQRICHAGYLNNQLLGNGEPNQPDSYNTEMEVDGIHGCCFLIRRCILPLVGRFDERFFMYAEEDDFCIRVKQAGYSVLYCPVSICHYGEGSTVSPTVRMTQHLESVAKLKQKWGFQ